MRKKKPFVQQFLQTYQHVSQQSDASFFLWIAIELMSVAIATSLLEYFAGWSSALEFDSQHPILRNIFAGWKIVLDHVPTPGLGAIALFFMLTWFQARFKLWPRWRIPYLLAIVGIINVALVFAPLRLATLICLYGVLAHAQMMFDRHGGKLVSGAVILGILPIFLYTNKITLLEIGIWGMGALLVQSFTGLGMRERNSRQLAEKLAAELSISAQQLREYAIHAEESAMLRERERVAREFHDTFAQSLSTTNMFLDASMMHMKKDCVKALELLNRARELTQMTLLETRSTILDLQSELFTMRDLPALLTELAQRTTTDERLIALNIDIPADISLMSSTVHVCYRVAQEALANALKHSGAKTISVEVSVEQTVLYLTVTDDGSGYDPSQTHRVNLAGGYGLVSMRERIRQIDGTFDIISAPGLGTQVIAAFPLASHIQEELNVANSCLAG